MFRVRDIPRRVLSEASRARPPQREFFIDNLLVRIHFIIVMIRWTGLAPWEFEFPFPGSLTSTFLVGIYLEESFRKLLEPVLPKEPGFGFRFPGLELGVEGSEEGSYLRLIDFCVTQL